MIRASDLGRKDASWSGRQNKLAHVALRQKIALRVGDIPKLVGLREDGADLRLLDITHQSGEYLRLGNSPRCKKLQLPSD
jgi:hypothetical protein